MSVKHALASMLHVFVVFLFFGAGLFFSALPYLPNTRLQLIHLLFNQPEKCTLIGLGFFGVSLLFFLGFYALTQGKYLVLKMGVSTDTQIIYQTVEAFFAKQFPAKIWLKEVEIGSKKRLEMQVDCAPLSGKEKEALLEEVEKGVSSLLYNRFGYTGSFLMVVKN